MPFSPSAIANSIRRVFLVIGVSALCGVLLAGLALPVVGALGLSARESSDWFRELDVDFQPGELSETSRVLDNDGDLLARFFEENRKEVKLKNISKVMINAILAIEDDRFFERGPIDFQGTLRALIRNVEAGETQGGGSTLTQQYVKQVRLSQADTDEERQQVLASSGVEGYRRKLEELRMAIGVEQEYTKEQILERYLNIAYFGSGAYGVEAAARTYFSTSAKKLNLTQAATLAGLVQSPSQYDPTRNPEAALGRRNVVLGRMAETGRISEKKENKAKQRDLNLKLSEVNNGCVSAWAGYFCDYVVNEIRKMEKLGGTPDEREYALKHGGLVITTTLDREAQENADDAIAEWADPDDEAIISLASVDPRTGHIKALANSRKYGLEGDGVSKINYAVNKDMGGGNGIQPGSSFKTWVLAAAINQGISLNTSINSPAQISIPQNQFKTCEGTYPVSAPWTPSNWDGAGGNYNLKTGTSWSVNTFFAQLAQRTGLCEPARIAEEAGIVRADNGESLHQVPSFPLGVNEVSPLAMAGGYGMFANRGQFCEPTAILTVKNRDGDMLVDHRDPKCERVLEKPVADAVTSVLQGVIEGGALATGAAMRMEGGRPAAGKTGTTQSSEAVWWVGYTPQLSTAVAVSDVDPPRKTLYDVTFRGQLIRPCGGCIPGPVWKEYMEETLEGEPNLDFEEPDSSVIKGVTVTVPDVRGMRVDEAIDVLEGDGFSASEGGRINSDLAEGLVVSTDPGANSEAPSGTNIRLFVSNGVPPGNEDDDDDDDDDDFRIPEEDPPNTPNPPDDDNSGGNGNDNGNDNGGDDWSD